MSLTPDLITNNSKIIDMDKYNGRINIVEPQSPDIRFKMQEQISLRNKATDFREAVTGIWEHNVLEQVFFSMENIQIIQNGLRAGVYNMSNNQYIIAPQNIDNLKIIMRSIYLQYAEHYANDITGQVSRLNQLVLDYAVPAVYGESVGYLKYCQDQSTLVTPFEIPKNHDRQYKQLELKVWY
jgi:hypothetical protein